MLYALSLNVHIKMIPSAQHEYVILMKKNETILPKTRTLSYDNLRCGVVRTKTARELYTLLRYKFAPHWISFGTFT